jgi:hypothetical protein
MHIQADKQNDEYTTAQSVEQSSSPATPGTYTAADREAGSAMHDEYNRHAAK